VPVKAHCESGKTLSMYICVSKHTYISYTLLFVKFKSL